MWLFFVLSFSFLVFWSCSFSFIVVVALHFCFFFLACGVCMLVCSMEVLLSIRNMSFSSFPPFMPLATSQPIVFLHGLHYVVLAPLSFAWLFLLLLQYYFIQLKCFKPINQPCLHCMLRVQVEPPLVWYPII